MAVKTGVQVAGYRAQEKEFDSSLKVKLPSKFADVDEEQGVDGAQQLSV